MASKQAPFEVPQSYSSQVKLPVRGSAETPEKEKISLPGRSMYVIALLGLEAWRSSACRLTDHGLEAWALETALSRATAASARKTSRVGVGADCVMAPPPRQGVGISWFFQR
jgi:hypothetical protein